MVYATERPVVSGDSDARHNLRSSCRQAPRAAQPPAGPEVACGAGLPRHIIYDALNCMTPYVALLRAVNVGGTGKLPMTELAAMCQAAGFARVRTYIASGNVVFASALDEPGVKAALQRPLAAYAGRPVGVLVRTADEMAAAVAANPFPDEPPNRTVAIFLDDEPPGDALDHVRHHAHERLALGHREIYVAYGERMGDSRLVIPAAQAGTARNMNTVAKLAELARAV